MAAQPGEDPDAERITPADLEDSFRRFAGDVESTVKSKALQWAPLIVGAAVGVVVVAYFLGRRVGATRSTVVEIRRI